MRFLDPKAIKDWIKSRAVNSMMTTEKGFFMDARQGPVIREELDDIQTGLNEINSKLQPQTKTISNNDVTVIFCKVGKIATLDVAMIGSAIPAGWTKILDIPNGYIPKIAGHSSGIDVDGNHAIMNCDAGGISIYTDNTFTANYLYINLVYFL